MDENLFIGPSNVSQVRRGEKKNGSNFGHEFIDDFVVVDNFYENVKLPEIVVLEYFW
jgi:hypothetical protein